MTWANDVRISAIQVYTKTNKNKKKGKFRSLICSPVIRGDIDLGLMASSDPRHKAQYRFLREAPGRDR